MEGRLTREERFKRAKEARERAKKEQGYGDFGPVEIPDFECAVLKPNTGHIIRLIGNSLEMAESPSDPLLVERSLIKGDDGKFFSYIWSSDSDHPMRKFMRTILGKYKWDKENRCRIYENAQIPVFQRWMTNGITGNPYNQGAMPQKYILFNCITKGNGDNWCKEHKHTKMLCWDSQTKEVDGQEKVYPTYGIKQSLYTLIFDQKCTELGVHFEDTDFVVRRYDKKTSPDGKTFVVAYAPEEKSAIRRMGEKDAKDYLSYVSDEDLTDEELAYERYNLRDIPFVSAVTPTSVVLSKLGKFIKEVDKEFGTNHYDELVELKAKELAELKAKKADTEASEDEQSEEENYTPTAEKVAPKAVTKEAEVDDSEDEDDLPSDVEDSVADESKEETTEEKAPVMKVKKVAKSEFKITQEMFDLFPALSSMSDKDKALITGFDRDLGELKFAEGDIAECPSCNNEIHDDFSVCPYCGQEFE